MTRDAVQERDAASIAGRRRLDPLFAEIERVLVGQRALVERIVIALLTGGHLLLEGVPGLAKTLAVRTLAQALHLSFQRIQFTPDLLPADVIGTQIYLPQRGEFTVRKGPIFANLVLADEINRAPAKVQSALLEAMQERQVTIGEHSFLLPEPFQVLATQNPIEHEGTYPLPEAQLDRFMFKVIVSYPSREEELAIIDRMAELQPTLTVAAVLGPDDVAELQRAVDGVYVDASIKNYALDIAIATRRPGEFGLDIGPLIQLGVSPRATVFLVRAAQGQALLQGRGHVTPDDVKAVAPDVLRHRLLLTFEAEAEDITPDALIRRILDRIPVP